MNDRVIAGRYRLLDRLGHGAMSEVWAADDPELEREVAIKLLGRDADPERFRREARAAAALAHPNICALYDYGTADDGRPFMVLESLRGGTLEERLSAGGPLDDGETARIAQEIAAGLAHAHARGVLHRDLKPGNILFDAEGRAKIADLGIARVSGSGTLTEAGTVLGTAAYISPEQARGEPATPASDVYSFGVLLFRMLTGRLPFESADPMALVAMHATEPSPPVRALRPDAPPRLESVAEAALAKDPADRPQDGSALYAELEPSAVATTVLAPPRAEAATMVAAPRQAQPPERKRAGRTAAIVGTAALVAAGGVAAAYLATSDGESPDTLPAPTVSVPTTAAATTEEAAPPPPPPATTEETTTEEEVPETTAPPPPPPPPPAEPPPPPPPPPPVEPPPPPPVEPPPVEPPPPPPPVEPPPPPPPTAPAAPPAQ